MSSVTPRGKEALGPAGEAFRPDIEGLRGLAILLVILFHAGLAGVTGGFVGVDVFFVISGFLITGLLLREQKREGRLGLTRFYARRVRRLLPAAAVVLIVTMAAVQVLVAPLDRAEIQLDGLASALSVGNIRFAAQAGDYFAAVNMPSPFLHFWSLGVEEQFYLVWPAVILLAARGRAPLATVGLALLGLAIVSFVASVVVTDIATNWAFYSLPTRAWQLALGGLLAVAATQLARIPGPVLAVLGWSGVAAMAGAALLYTDQMAYPGLAALVPTAGAAAVIAAGATRRGPASILTLAPMRWLGRISYSLYLWHWPLLVLVPIAVGAELDLAQRIAVVLAALAISTFSWAAIEEPFRRGFWVMARRPGRTVAVGLAGVLVIAVSAGSLAVVSVRDVEAIGMPDGSAVASTSEDRPDQEWDALWDSWDSENAASARPTTTADASVGEVPGPPTDDPSPGQGPTPAPTIDGGPVASPTSGDPEATPDGSDGTPSPEPAPTTDPPPATEPPPAGGAHGPLPADVEPPLARARSNTELLMRDGCLVRESVVRPPNCTFGDANGAKTLALVGDSHASQWFPALEEIARHRHWRVVTFVKMNCPWTDIAVRHIDLKREYTECQTWNEAVIARLQEIRPDLTLVSMSRWAVKPVRSASLEEQAEAMARMLGRVPGRTALLADTPYPRIDIPACLSAHLNDVTKCSFGRGVAFSGNASAREPLAAQLAGVPLIDLNPQICPGEGACPAVIDKFIVYRDPTHLTAVFARWLARPLDAAIKPLM